MTELKEQRLKNRMTQREAAEKAGISLRSYISYENQEDKKGTPMYRLLLAEMSELGRLDEEHGILTMEEIREACGEYELAEKLREKLRKKIDLLDVKQLAGNSELLNEVLKDGIRIYG